MRLLLLSKYGRQGASSRLRSYQYLPFLKNQGFNIDIAPLFDDSYIINLYTGRSRKGIIKSYATRIIQVLKSRKYDLIWIEKEILPWLPPWGEELLSAFNIKYIVDYDDAIFHRYDLIPNKLIKKIMGRKIDNIMKKASIVIAGNEYIAKRAVCAGAKKVEIIPTVIDLKRYPMDKNPATKYSQKKRFAIGWIGSPITAPFLYNIYPALKKFCANNNAHVVTIGAGDLNMKDIITKDYPWSEQTEVCRIKTFDVGIMPLPDTPWTRGKCGYKLIQYMACGKPVIASAVGANLTIVDNDKNGFLVNSDTEWINALTTLCENNILQRNMGLNGRKKIEKNYCTDVTAPKLTKLIKELI